MCSDFQEVRIQEPLQSISVGSLPRSISVILEDDLADCVQAGGERNANSLAEGERR